MLDEKSKPYFVGKGVRLWRRPDFMLRGVPFQAFAVDYRDGMIEIICLDKRPAGGEAIPVVGGRMIMPINLLGGIEAVSEDELMGWLNEADYRLPISLR